MFFCTLIELIVSFLYQLVCVLNGIYKFSCVQQSWHLWYKLPIIMSILNTLCNLVALMDCIVSPHKLYVEVLTLSSSE